MNKTFIKITILLLLVFTLRVVLFWQGIKNDIQMQYGNNNSLYFGYFSWKKFITFYVVIPRHKDQVKINSNFKSKLSKIYVVVMWDAYHAKFRSIQKRDICHLRKFHITYMDLSFKNWHSIPKEIGNLSFLEYLSLSNNNLRSIPKEIGNLSSLKYLFLSNNKITSLPQELNKLSSLEYLYAHSNQIRGFDIDAPKLKVIN
ncbi:leucine-rich repeat domain-containing protein [Candidatus Uabimicrobium amorphum]|uniref:leucine-rich repeat domain-containing protein n=1 Tax=Uabimicrobium amorphum TaxID=2596890 RepID=UPI00125F691A|nr:leucine-rich repeat domain-containing protein [Candidatus Uabimicrobium amorphum]